MIKSSPIEFSYDANANFHFPSLNCGQGEEMLLLGQSGCGKTTFLHLLAGLLRPNKGSIEIDSTDICKLNSYQLDKFRGQHIGMVFQVPHFIKALSVKENLQLAQKLAGKPQDNKLIQQLLDSLNIGHHLNKKTYHLSQGEQQRVSIARALVNKPSLLLADEPTSALDDKNANEVAHLMMEQAKAHDAALLVVTHDARLKDLFQKRVDL